MTIKKPIKPTSEAATAAPAPGGATIADRFKLDVPDPKAKAKAGGPATTAAFIAALVALAVAGVLAFTLYQHWEFLKGA